MKFQPIRLNQTWCQTAVEAGNATLGVKFLDDLHKGSTSMVFLPAHQTAAYHSGGKKMENVFQCFEELLLRVPSVSR